tara:strand:+ start:249 stop:1085 length:837 start_codon:yes stop_codon:yes gene_type:complete
MANVLFIADFFANQVPGGGELNNDVLIKKLRERGHDVHPINSHLLKNKHLLGYDNIIVSNFVNLSEANMKKIQRENYIIYEHDHKYLSNRNPGIYPDYRAPRNHIINKQFYTNAKAVLCQSTFHANIVTKNLELNNIKSLGGNLWADTHFDLLQQICKESNKKPTYAVMQSPTPHKNTLEAVRYCKALGLQYDLIPPSDPVTFLKRLGSHSTLVFFPKTPETLSRVVVEARMMGLATKTTNNIGAIHEKWFSKKGLTLIDYLRSKQGQIVDAVEKYIK